MGDFSSPQGILDYYNSMSTPASPAGPGPTLDPAMQQDTPGGVTPQSTFGPGPMENNTPSSTSSTTSKNSESNSSGERGFSGDKYKQVDRTTKGPEGVDQRMADIDQRAGTQYQNEMAPILRAGEERKEAIDKGAHAEADKLAAEADEKGKIGALQQSYAGEEQKQTAIAQTKEQTALFNYQAALADFRSSRVNPGELWGNMTGGQHFGTLASIFASDFLAAGPQHTQTSVMDTLNRAVDKNIAAQVENIRNKGEVANGFQKLWEMQVQQSHSEAEARTRVRGFLLDGMKNQLESTFGQYDSDIAKYKGQEAMAAVDGEIAKNNVDVQNMIHTQAQADKGLALNEWSTKAHLAIESTNASTARMKETREAKAAAKTAQDKFNENVIRDPSRSGGGAPLGIGMNEKATKDLQDAAATRGNIIDLTDEFRTLANKVGKSYDGPLSAKVNDPDVARMKQIRVELLTDIAKAKSGTQYSDKFLNQLEQMIPEDTWLSTSKKADYLGAQLQQMTKQAFDTELSAKGRQVQPDEQPLIYQGISRDKEQAVGQYAADVPKGMSGPEVADATGRVKAGPDNAPASDAVDQTYQKLYSKDRGDLIEKGDASSKNIESYWSAFTGQDAEFHALKTDRSGHSEEVGNIPQWADTETSLHDIAADPHGYTPTEHQKALDKLVQQAFPDPNMPVWDKQEQLYAQYLLYDLTKQEGAPDDMAAKAGQYWEQLHGATPAQTDYGNATDTYLNSIKGGENAR